MRKRFVALSLVFSLVTLPIVAQNGSGDLLARIRTEAMERSQIMKTMHMFTDVYGPRLTGSPNHRNAAEWAVKQMQSCCCVKSARNGSVISTIPGSTLLSSAPIRRIIADWKSSSESVQQTVDSTVQ